ncbi:odorant receptor Or2-like [Ochlerotatus camptorhynchus]|uniref:odorant receptor Or2-like n=1 Tax=Ochlerotatus camptorhynchus TaxID=644619 RepID=UPI0031E32456
MSSTDKILACPIVSINARVWRFWSFILKHDYMRYISIPPVTVMTVLMFTDLYRAWGNIGEVIINAYFAVLFFNAVLRTLILVYYHEEYESFLEKIAVVYKEIEAMQDDAIRNMVELFTKRARMMSISNLALGAFISACFVVYPLFTGERRLPYGMYISGVNQFESPLYEILFVTQAVLTFPGCCMYIPFTSFFVSTSLFGLIQIKSLQYRLENFQQCAAGKSNKEQRSQLEAIINDHQRVIAYVGELNGLVANICLLELLSFGMMLCALLFLLIVIDHMAQIIIVVAYIFMIISQIFAFYWHANEVREESMAIAEAAYSGPWVEVDQASKKKLLLIILRAQVPLEISVGNVYPMTLEMFQSLLNASYSYFTLLRRVYN